MPTLRNRWEVRGKGGHTHVALTERRLSAPSRNVAIIPLQESDSNPGESASRRATVACLGESLLRDHSGANDTMNESQEIESAESGPSSGAITLAIATFIGLWIPWIGFAYWYVEVGGFHSGIFTAGTTGFLLFTAATWVVTPVFTVIYVVYAMRSAPRNTYDQVMFAIECLILLGMWAVAASPFVGR